MAATAGKLRPSPADINATMSDYDNVVESLRKRSQPYNLRRPPNATLAAVETAGAASSRQESAASGNDVSPGSGEKPTRRRSSLKRFGDSMRNSFNKLTRKGVVGRPYEKNSSRMQALEAPVSVKNGGAKLREL